MRFLLIIALVYGLGIITGALCAMYDYEKERKTKMTVREAVSFIRGFEHLQIGHGNTAFAEYCYKTDILNAPARHCRTWDYQVLFIEQLADPDWLWLEVREL